MNTTTTKTRRLKIYNHDAECDDAIHEELKELRKRKQELERFLHDAAGYLAYTFKKGQPDAAILTTLAHDIWGLERKERCFVPRVTGYGHRAVRL